MNVKVPQRQRGERGHRKNKIRRNGAGIVETTLRAVGVNDSKASCCGVEKAIRGEEVQCHNITPSEKTRQEGDRIQKGVIQVKSDAGLTTTVGGRGKNCERIKTRKFAPIYRRVLKGNNRGNEGQLSEGPEQGKEHISAPEAVVLNECEGFRRGRGVLLTAPRWLGVMH